MVQDIEDKEMNEFIDNNPTTLLKEIWDILDIREDNTKDYYYEFNF